MNYTEEGCLTEVPVAQKAYQQQ